MGPSIAVIVPVRNGISFLPGAIDCVESQGYAPLELVIIDDGSTDGSLEYAAKSARVLQTPSIGPAAARNAGITATSSDLVAFLDVDDLWPPGTLLKLADTLAANPDASFAQGLTQNFRDLPDGSRRFFTTPYRFLNIGASLYRRSVFETVGLFDPTMTLCEDLDFLMRAWEKDVRKAELDEITLFYRRHPQSMTSGLKASECGTVQAFKRRIDRIRAGTYDPKQTRRVPAIEYLGTAPPHQDEEGA